VKRKLKLERATIRVLDEPTLSRAGGGSNYTNNADPITVTCYTCSASTSISIYTHNTYCG
jgi:hypothetical protein